MQNNLFFLCGPHGSGKTTLGKEIARINNKVEIPELYCRNIKFNTDPAYRQVLKMSGRAIENFEYLKIAKENPKKIILANRCIYDVLAYNYVYYKQGWTDKNTFEDYNRLAYDFFRNENKQPYAIVLNPPYEVCREHLGERWKEKGKKWKEEDESYLMLACNAYEEFKDNENIFYIDHEIDLESKADIVQVNEWMQEFYSRNKLIPQMI